MRTFAVCSALFASAVLTACLAAAADVSTTPLEAKQLEEAWQELGRMDDEGTLSAGRHMRTLSANPRQAVAFLRERLLNPEPVPGAKEIDGWIAQLDSDDFQTRQKAYQSLHGTGVITRPRLERAIKQGALSLETRRRLERLLAQLEGVKLAPSQLRDIRAVEVLFEIGDPEAVSLLQTLAKGQPESMLTREALAAVRLLQIR